MEIRDWAVHQWHIHQGGIPVGKHDFLKTAYFRRALSGTNRSERTCWLGDWLFPKARWVSFSR